MTLKIADNKTDSEPSTDSGLSNMHPMTAHIIASKQDTDGRQPAAHSQQLLPEDEFHDLYYSTEHNQRKVVAPPFDPKVLSRIVQENNTLLQAVSAMEVNIDGTGFEIELNEDFQGDDEGGDEDSVVAQVRAFLKEPWPRQSFITQRRALRRDLENTGNAYLEVIRNPIGEIVMLRPVESCTMRLCRLSDPILETVRVQRGDQEVEVEMYMRHRSYIQCVGRKYTYFKDFGVELNINRRTGEWFINDNAGTEDDIFSNWGNEIIHLKVIEDSNTPYGLPRWINNIPSAIGSREAEELNLTYFDSGGIPPILIMLSGGALVEKSRQALQSFLDTKPTNKAKMRGIVLEAQPTAGDIDSNTVTKVAVEKFGSEKQEDMLFGEYDSRCERHIRKSFRLPPIFLGTSEDINFASAKASYEVAEAQVFRPERVEFDEIINVTVLRELGQGRAVMRSRPLSITDVEFGLEGIEAAKDLIAADPISLLEQINEIADINIKTRSPEELREIESSAQAAAAAAAQTNAQQLTTNPDESLEVEQGEELSSGDQTDSGENDSRNAVQRMDLPSIERLASDEYAVLSSANPSDPIHLKTLKTVANLDCKTRELVLSRVAVKMFGDIAEDPEGAKEMVECLEAWHGDLAKNIQDD